jgi:predicted O-methyltransferase YrrM
MSTPGKEGVSKAAATIERLFADADRSFLRSAISQEEGAFLESLASRPGVRNSIEVGCANGISSIYICSGIQGKKDPHHCAIDPFQTSFYKGKGMNNVRNAGFDFFDVIEKGSEVALPELLAAGKTYDMCLIDGLHTADQTLVDFYYLDRMLPPGGIMVVDDVNMTAVNKIVQYISTYPNYRLIGTSGKRGYPRWSINVLKQMMAIALWPLRKVFGESTVREFWDISLIHPQNLWTLDSCTMAAFEKTGEHFRDTDWYRGI